MNSHSYDQLLKSKHRLSLLLFLFLNASSAIFSMILPSPKTPAMTLPIVMITAISLGTIAYLILISKKYEDKLNYFSIVLGVLWAWQIILKYEYLGTNENNYLYSINLKLHFSASGSCH